MPGLGYVLNSQQLYEAQSHMLKIFWTLANHLASRILRRQDEYPLIDSCSVQAGNSGLYLHWMKRNLEVPNPVQQASLPATGIALPSSSQPHFL